MGLCLHEGALTYGLEHGALRWAPMWLKRAIVRLWNPINCMMRGHDKSLLELYKAGYLPEVPTCCNCGTELMVDGFYVTPAELHRKREIVRENFKKLKDKTATE